MERKGEKERGRLRGEQKGEREGGSEGRGREIDKEEGGRVWYGGRGGEWLSFFGLK